MKLAVALQLRTTITDAIQRQPAPIIAHRTGSSAVTQRSGISGSGVGPIGQPKPLTDVKSFRIDPLVGLETHLETLPKPAGVLEFDVETQQMYRQLETLDAAIQEANHTVKHAMPSNVPLEPGDVAGAKKTLASFLLRRKTLRERATRLEQYLVATPQKPTITRVKIREDIDDLTVVYPLLDEKEIRQTYNRTMMSLRAIDNLIQQANWQVDINVPTWVKQGFLTDDVEPVPEAPTATKKGKEAKTVEPAPMASPVAPMLSVSGAPVLKPAGAPKLTPPAAAATPAIDTGVFIPPALGNSDSVADDDTDDTDGWTS